MRGRFPATAAAERNDPANALVAAFIDDPAIDDPVPPAKTLFVN
jgi:hypothetical protein